MYEEREVLPIALNQKANTASFRPYCLRTLYKLLYPAAKVYWFIVRPETSGVRCLIECDGKLLFIRQTYGDRRWSVPGGGINRNETPEEAVQREVSEEVGLLLSNVSFLGRFVSTDEFKNDAVHCYFARVEHFTLNLDLTEIQEAEWFSANALPEPQSSHAQMILRLYHAQGLSIRQ